MFKISCYFYNWWKLKTVYRVGVLCPWESFNWKSLNHPRISFLFHTIYSNYCLISSFFMRYVLTVNVIFLSSLAVK
jgi:hypothetical protein